MAVFFLVLIYFFTKTWRWFHILCVFSVFVSTIFLARNTAFVYRTLNAWRVQEAKLAKQAAALELERDMLRYGDLEGGEQKDESIQSINGKVTRAIIDLGRVWRSCTPQGVQADGSVVLNTIPPGMEAAPAAPAEVPPAAAPAAPADPAAAAAAGAPAAPAPAPAAPAGPPPNGIEKDIVLYVFVEDVAPAEAALPAGSKVPRYYLGEFKVADATDTSVTVAPVFPLSPVDLNVLRQPNMTWSLYETLPVDGHELFSKTPDTGGKLNESAEQFSVFGEMDPALIQVLFPVPDRRFYENEESFQIATQRHAVRIQNYLRDGKRAQNDDHPLHIWLKLRFKEKYSEVVDSGARVSALQLGATDDFFDRGLSEISMLQRGSKADVKPGDVAVIPQEDEGKRLLQEKTNDGKPICELIEPVYVRPLNNYGFLFRDVLFRQQGTMSDIVRIQRDLAQIKKSDAHIKEQQTVANSEQTRLKSDIEKTTLEKTKILEYQAALEKSTNELKATLSQLYRTSHELEALLEQLYQQQADEINRRTRSVAGTR